MLKDEKINLLIGHLLDSQLRISRFSTNNEILTISFPIILNVNDIKNIITKELENNYVILYYQELRVPQATPVVLFTLKRTT